MKIAQDEKEISRVVRPVWGVRVTILYSWSGDDMENGTLSIHGSGRHGCGQIYEYLTEDEPREPFSKVMCIRLRQVWERWHLNDMRAGTPAQEEFIRGWKRKGYNPSGDFYTQACEALKEQDLYIDHGYKYGSAWLFEKVPEDILEWLFNLPGEGDCFTRTTGFNSVTDDIDMDLFMSIIKAR